MILFDLLVVILHAEGQFLNILKIGHILQHLRPELLIDKDGLGNGLLQRGHEGDILIIDNNFFLINFLKPL